MDGCFALTGARQHCVSTVLVMLMSRNDFHVVSALRSIVFDLYTFFLADQVSCKSYVGSAYRMRSLAVI